MGRNLTAKMFKIILIVCYLNNISGVICGTELIINQCHKIHITTKAPYNIAGLFGRWLKAKNWIVYYLWCNQMVFPVVSVISDSNIPMSQNTNTINVLYKMAGIVAMHVEIKTCENYCVCVLIMTHFRLYLWYYIYMMPMSQNTMTTDAHVTGRLCPDACWNQKIQNAMWLLNT